MTAGLSAFMRAMVSANGSFGTTGRNDVGGSAAAAGRMNCSDSENTPKNGAFIAAAASALFVPGGAPLRFLGRALTLLQNVCCEPSKMHDKARGESRGAKEAGTRPTGIIHAKSGGMPTSTRTRRRAQPKQRQPVPPFPKQHLQPPGLEAALDPLPRFKAPAYRAAKKLAGRNALITGGDSGIGRAVAVLFAREGARVAISYLPEEESDARLTKREVEKVGGKCFLLPGDLTRRSFCDELIEQAVDRLGSLEVLVCNAAHQIRKERPEDVTDEEFDTTFRTNIYAYFWLVRAALPRLARGSCIIATSSETGILGSPKLLDYSATKGAINAFTKALAVNLIPRGIRVNAVAPGPSVDAAEPC